jgi:phage terminase large subunit-like protein
VGEALDSSAIERWRADPASFIEECMVDPETGKPFTLLPCEHAFIEHAFATNDAGRLIYPEQVFSCPKKTGKTTFAAMHILTTTLVFGGRFAEGYAVANDLEQARGRVFEAVRRIVEASPYLRREAQVIANRITFPSTGATIQAIASDAPGAAGSNPVISSFDELWGYTSERSHRLFDEMIPPPTRKIACRLTTTYAGFEGESKLLEGLYERGLSQPEVGPDLYAGDGLLMYWTHEPQAPWQTPEWIEQMRGQLRPHAYLRMIENRFAHSEESFVDPAWWDACAIARPVPADPSMSVWVGVDASTKRDSTGIAVVTWDKATKKARLVWHRIITPRPGAPIDFESHVEETLLGLKSRFRVREVRYDPYQMAATAQRMTRAGLNMVEFPQSTGNLTAASQNLYELVKGENIVVYPDNEIRLAIQRAVAVESTRGWRIAKDKASHKIDIVVALAQAALGAVQKGEGGSIQTSFIWWGNGEPPPGWNRHLNEERDHSRVRVVRVNEKGDELTSEEAQAIQHELPAQRKKA